MDAPTVAVYERRAREWIERRGEATDGLGATLRERAGPGPVADLGCGAGRYLGELGEPVVGVDATAAMLALARRSAAPLVRADLEALPFAAGSLCGAFARHSYLHLPRERLGGALLDAHRALRPGAPLLLTVIEGSYQGHGLPGDDFEGRFFACWRADELSALLRACGFHDVAVEMTEPRAGQHDLVAVARA